MRIIIKYKSAVRKISGKVLVDIRSIKDKVKTVIHPKFGKGSITKMSARNIHKTG